MSGQTIDSSALLEIQGVGSKAFSDRSELHRRIVQIAMALDVECVRFASDEVHAQYMELCDRIMDRISNAKAEPSARSDDSSPVPCSVADLYELQPCEKCLQMTNHLDGVCQKCKQPNATHHPSGCSGAEPR